MNKENTTITITLTEEELNLVLCALDSHAYWQLADEDERDDGNVVLHTDEDGMSIACDKDCPVEHAEIQACEALGDRLVGLSLANKQVQS